MSAPLALVVAAAHQVVPGVRALALRDPSGAPLPAHPPGSHVVLEGGGTRAAYSLTGSGSAPEHYAVSVLRRPRGTSTRSTGTSSTGTSSTGTSASAWAHRLRVGDPVACSRPRSTFAPVATARHHLLVAGGIGVTPLLSHARAAALHGRAFTLLLAARRGAPVPHLAELEELCGPRLALVRGREELVATLAEQLAHQPLGTHLLTCGPPGMIDAVTALARRAGWPPQRVHTERFTSAALDPGRPFTAHLARRGLQVAVPAGTSLLDALLAAGVPVPHLCRSGVCGECRVGVLAGAVEHRDLVLSEGERAQGLAMMACVSRAAPGLEVDL